MRVLFVCEGFNEDSIKAQPWRHVFEVASRMDLNGDEVSVLTDESPGAIKNETVNGLKVRRIKKGKYLFDAKQLQKNVDGDYDLVNWNASGTLSAMNFLRINGPKNSAWTLHSGIIGLSDTHGLKWTEILSLTEFWNNILYSMSSGIFARRAASLPSLKAILTLSQRLKDYLLSIGVKEEKIHVTYSGVDVDIFAPRKIEEIKQARDDLSFHNDDQIVLYYGPLSPFRGVDELLAAMPDVISHCPSSKFVFLGRTLSKDAKNANLRESIAHGHRTVLVEGVQSQESLVKYLCAADILVLPFRFWPYVECPLTVLEAMSVAKPLVTTPIGAIPEIVQNGINGLVVKPKGKEIAAAIVKLLQDGRLATDIARNAREYVEKNHSWDIIVKQTREIFQLCL